MLNVLSAEPPTDEPETEPKSEPETEPTSEPETEPESEPEIEPTSEPETEPKSEPETEPTSEPEEGDQTCPTCDATLSAKRYQPISQQLFSSKFSTTFSTFDLSLISTFDDLRRVALSM